MCPSREHRHEHEVDDVFLADDDAADVGLDLLGDLADGGRGRGCGFALLVSLVILLPR